MTPPGPAGRLTGRIRASPRKPRATLPLYICLNRLLKVRLTSSFSSLPFTCTT